MRFKTKGTKSKNVAKLVPSFKIHSTRNEIRKTEIFARLHYPQVLLLCPFSVFLRIFLYIDCSQKQEKIEIAIWFPFT